MWRTSGGKGRSILVASVLAGCGTPAQQDQAPATQVATAIDRASALWRDPVTAERPQRVLYTWTTAEQIAELRRDRKLLVRESSPTNGASYFERVVHALAERGDAIAKLLDTTTFAKSRFAWPAPWATREGFPGESYGDQLIRVTLRPNAIVLALSTATGVFTARALDGTPVPLAGVRPERIGAVYFESARDALAPGIPQPSAAYREYVLCNEAMIASWSVGTQDIADELAHEAAALDALAAELRTGPLTAEREQRYVAALAFPTSSNYALGVAELERMARDLRATPRPAAIEGAGTTWLGLGPARTLPAKRRVPRGTYGTFGTY